RRRRRGHRGFAVRAAGVDDVEAGVVRLRFGLLARQVAVQRLGVHAHLGADGELVVAAARAAGRGLDAGAPLERAGQGMRQPAERAVVALEQVGLTAMTVDAEDARDLLVLGELPARWRDHVALEGLEGSGLEGAEPELGRAAVRAAFGEEPDEGVLCEG